jgi:hypothetical protein
VTGRSSRESATSVVGPAVGSGDGAADVEGGTGVGAPMLAAATIVAMSSDVTAAANGARLIPDHRSLWDTFSG